jgi:hypothetical protein
MWWMWWDDKNWDEFKENVKIIIVIEWKTKEEREKYTCDECEGLRKSKELSLNILEGNKMRLMIVDESMTFSDVIFYWRRYSEEIVKELQIGFMVFKQQANERHSNREFEMREKRRKKSNTEENR